MGVRRFLANSATARQTALDRARSRPSPAAKGGFHVQTDHAPGRPRRGRARPLVVGRGHGSDRRPVRRGVFLRSPLPIQHCRCRPSPQHLRPSRHSGQPPADHTGARRVVEADRRHHLGVHAAQRSQVPRRLGLRRRRRHRLARASPTRQDHGRLHLLHESDCRRPGRGCVHDPNQDEDDISVAASRPQPGLHHLQGGRGERGVRALQYRRQRGWDRPLQVLEMDQG